MAILVLRILPSFDLDLEEIAHTFSKIFCNAFTICDPQLKPLGTGIPRTSSIGKVFHSARTGGTSMNMTQILLAAQSA
ncbi:hypothetical protein GUJ93_ZPchr0004g38228 [Zizania palustris]|uniref:Uncharacterized protein n=1 Tax=Zizania palustris TaxID=103762 RepID=A0A8J5VFV8_ZIZPA|nr:hypothetical protein GUJ93_ZPchr0004g38228 [Zizania palustris]